MRAFILGNSGELLDHDLSLLQGEVVFGCNALPLRCPEIITHYVCLDFAMAFATEVRSLVFTSSQKWYSRLMWNAIYKEDNVNVYDCWPDGPDGFAISTEKVYGGQTVAYTMLQLAAGMGYDEIYLLGVDLGIPPNGIRHIPENDKLIDLIHSKNLSDGPLFDKREPNPDHEVSCKAIIHKFVYAKKILEETGIKVYNLSKGGNLKCFPRKVYEEVLSKINHQTGVIPEVEINN